MKMLDRTLKPEDVLLVDMGLINRCNLACPVCPYTQKNVQSQTREFTPIKEFIEFLDKLPNLEVGILEGNYSEPTLYPHLPELISYLKSRGIRLRLSTNGDAHNDAYWHELGKLFDENDIIRFDIDGSTQEMHGKYRIGGNLERTLNHHRALKETTKGKTVLQNIVFHYNVQDKDGIMDIFYNENFNYVSFIKAYIHSYRTDKDMYFRPTDDIHKYNELYKKISKTTELSINCDAFNRKEIYVNHKGELILCGTLDEAGSNMSNPNITDDLDTIFEKLSFTASNIYNCETCKGDCNKFCYTLGEKYPDITIGRDGVPKEVNYFTKEIYNEEGNICHQLV